MTQHHAEDQTSGPSTAALDDFQSFEQRNVLDTVAQIRKCGLEAVLPLPQLVVCGDQSAGKSSVLEALTEIPFPRDDNLCTRFATEITLRRAPTESLCLHIIPDPERPSSEKTAIAAFSETIQNLADLPKIMNKAKEVMGISTTSTNQRTFARDTLSLEIEGPHRPQLTLVDVPGLFRSETKGVSKQDRETVEKITDFYISQHRTICLAVVAASHDYANQGILSRVREVDPNGERTLGIITKPDKLDQGSGSEASFLNLARNEDVFFKLGWHVVKNRKFEESHFTVQQRNIAEEAWFQTSDFQLLPADDRGIDKLRIKLSGLLFNHIKNELPNLRRDLDKALSDVTSQLDTLGSERATARDCRRYLTELNMTCMDITNDAIDGHYEASYFIVSGNEEFDISSASSIRRLRAVIQYANTDFTKIMHDRGSKYVISETLNDKAPKREKSEQNGLPIEVSRDEALKWVSRVLVRSRGKEPSGNYNPLIIGDLFWEQSEKWKELAQDHIETVFSICATFLDTLLLEKCPKDIYDRLSATKVSEALKDRQDKASEELGRIIDDKQGFPTVYNSDYTKHRQVARTERMQAALASSLEQATVHQRMDGCKSVHTYAKVDVAAAVLGYHRTFEEDMERYSCDDALDCLLSIYATQRETFVANVTAQVIERHMIRGLDKIFSPLNIADMTDEEVLEIASEPASVKRQRDFLLDRQEKLKDGKAIFRKVMGTATK